MFSRPCRYTDPKGNLYLEFGGYDSGIACFKQGLLTPGQESPVFETRGVSGLFETAANFVDWFESRSRAARKHYKRKEWQQILCGPAPFNAEEQAIVHARKVFCWRVIGVASNGNLLFEVTNNSSRVLPYLTIGVRTPNFDGGVWLPVASIAPGTTAIIQRDAYKDIAEPHTVEAFHEPDPLPEDRDRYWEFRPINAGVNRGARRK